MTTIDTMPRNPYLLDRPAVIHVSGGRTSGFMLRKIIDAFGGTLPNDVIPVFCNTGLEHEATYRFLKELGDRWCPIVWLEYRWTPDAETKHGFAVVDYCSASRHRKILDAHEAIAPQRPFPKEPHA